MNETNIVEIWALFKTYVEKKSLADAAEKYVEVLVENGVSDGMLEAAVGSEIALDRAIEYYLNEESEDDY